MGVRIGSRTIWLCSDCNRAAENKADEPEEEFDYACDVLDWHFASIPRSRLVTTIRQFPGHMRADVQTAVDRLFGNAVRLVGLDEEQRYERPCRFRGSSARAATRWPLPHSNILMSRSAKRARSSASIMVCGCASRIIFVTQYCSVRIANLAASLEFALKSPCPREPQVWPSSSGASATSSRPYRPRVPIAARSFRRRL